MNTTRVRPVLGSLALVLMLGLPLPALAQVCGDGLVDGGEACDDGNTRDGDGCSAACAVEAGYNCFAQAPLSVANGGFEAGDLTGWTLLTGTVDVLSDTTASGCWPSAEASYSIDLNGSSRGQIQQALATTGGETYTVTFMGSANCTEFGGDSCNNACTKILTVSATSAAAPDTPLVTQTIPLDGSPLNAGWTPYSFSFTATSDSTLLTFSGSDPSLAGPMIDDVTVAESVCRPDTCGNGTIEAWEGCDDGNAEGGDGCSALCGLETGYSCPTAGQACTSTCGDGIAVSAEGCDDGDVIPGDGCSDTCTVEPGYACVVDPMTVRSVCTFTCGNGVLDAGEFCDDGNTVTETCAYGETGCTVCDASCREVAGATSFCGDGVVDPGEACDDGNAVTEACAYGEGACTVCDASCQEVAGAVSSCGDGVVDPGEACDDGNVVTEACAYGETACTVCDESCQEVAGAVSLCGDGVVDPYEICDDGNTVTETCPYGEGGCSVCDASCREVAGATSFCGDGTTDAAAGEACDDGNEKTEACAYGETACTVCDESCQEVAGATSFCGDGVLNLREEECDDGNTVDGDGCSQWCQDELTSTSHGCQSASGRTGAVAPLLVLFLFGLTRLEPRVRRARRASASASR